MPMRLATLLLACLLLAPLGATAFPAPGGPAPALLAPGWDAGGLATAARDAGILAAARAALAQPAAGAAPGPALAAEARSLALAEEVLAIAASGEEPLAALVRADRLVSAWQLAALGMNPAQAPAMRPLAPSVGLAELAATHHTTLDAASAAAAADLDALPESVRDAVGTLIGAFLAYEAATRHAFAAGGPAGAGPDVGPLEAAQPPAFDGTGSAPLRIPVASVPKAAPGLPAVLAARTLLLDAAVATRDALAAHPPGLPVPVVDVPGVVRIDLGVASQTHLVDYALLVDAGGNDVYRNNAGGSNFDRDCAVGTPFDLDPTGYLWSPGAAAVLDLAGNDDYGNTTAPCAWGLNGGAYLGAGLLVDTAGDDTYRAVLDANGAGYFGAGLLLDAAGNDRYLVAHPNSVASYATNGFGYSGVGALLDGGGADVYTASIGGNGGASLGGAGALLDLGDGADSYRAFSIGNGGASVASAAFLLDAGGDDVYDGGGFFAGGGTNGAGYSAGSAGFLLDAAGDDRYLGRFTVANGGGFTGAAGMLLDLHGRDTYTSLFGASNGGAAFAAAGFLLDGDGDDTYDADRQGGVNGGAVQFAAALLLDQAGNDRYEARASGGVQDLGANGGAVNGAAGALLDLAGDDAYGAVGLLGTNGGARQGPLPACNLPDCPGVPAVALLMDAQGLDVYRDNSGTWVDRTVAPKGIAGAQLDLPHGP